MGNMDKKHEDVGGVAQIDKTSVFQEGTATHVHSLLWSCGVLLAVWELTLACSASLQPKSRLTTEMQSGMLQWPALETRDLNEPDLDQARPAPLHR